MLVSIFVSRLDITELANKIQMPSSGSHQELFIAY